MEGDGTEDFDRGITQFSALPIHIHVTKNSVIVHPLPIFQIAQIIKSSKYNKIILKTKTDQNYVYYLKKIKIKGYKEGDKA